MLLDLQTRKTKRSKKDKRRNERETTKKMQPFRVLRSRWCELEAVLLFPLESSACPASRLCHHNTRRWAQTAKWQENSKPSNDCTCLVENSMSLEQKREIVKMKGNKKRKTEKWRRVKLCQAVFYHLQTLWRWNFHEIWAKKKNRRWRRQEAELGTAWTLSVNRIKSKLDSRVRGQTSLSSLSLCVLLAFFFPCSLASQFCKNYGVFF